MDAAQLETEARILADLTPLQWASTFESVRQAWRDEILRSVKEN